jgi:hypothetical protein
MTSISSGSRASSRGSGDPPQLRVHRQAAPTIALIPAYMEQPTSRGWATTQPA